MNHQTHLSRDGYVTIPAPGTGWGTVRFGLIHSPADADRIAPDAPDTGYACTTETRASPTYCCARSSLATSCASPVPSPSPTTPRPSP